MHYNKFSTTSESIYWKPEDVSYPIDHQLLLNCQLNFNAIEGPCERKIEIDTDGWEEELIQNYSKPINPFSTVTS